MKITDISLQAKNKDRVNISVDGKYRFSLDVFQVGELGLKLEKEFSEEELLTFEQESQFGKLYGRALEYCFMRTHSAKEVRDYLRRKTIARRDKSGELRPGINKDITDRVFARLSEKGYIDDEKFARFWVENRNQSKGTSVRRLIAELRSKGVAQVTIDLALADTPRDEKEDLRKIIAKKANRYDDDQKLIAYLARQGFSYDLIKETLNES